MKTVSQLKTMIVAMPRHDKTFLPGQRLAVYREVWGGIVAIEKNAFTLPLSELAAARALLPEVEAKIAYLKKKVGG